MKDNETTVAVIGLGYIGLPTAAVLSESGIRVIGVDVNRHAVETINEGRIHIVEPGLEEAVSKSVKVGLLRAQVETPNADAFIVAVPTPFKNNNEPDISYIESAAASIAPKLNGGELIVLESTSPPGATARMADVILGIRPDLSLDNSDPERKIYIAHCPERVLPGRVMVEMYENDRIVGGLNEGSAERAKSLYEVFCRGEILVTDAKTAEMAKLVENAFRDVNIAFANELSLICDSIGVNVWELIDLANHHPRVNILQPGPGVGGHCIAVDPWFIVSTDRENSKLIKRAREVNDSKPEYVLGLIDESIKKYQASNISILGIAFKADIDDLRESPALNITTQLAMQHPEVKFEVIEPNVSALPTPLSRFSNVLLNNDLASIKSSQLTVILVNHKEFTESIKKIQEYSDGRIIDTRGIIYQDGRLA